MNANGDPK